jgi:hypothetical protein
MTQALIAPFGRSVDGLAGTWPRGRSRAVRARAREPELWERRAEPYPGAVVLDDLPDAVGDAAATERIVARFAATRLVLLALRGDLDAAAMADERAIARSYVERVAPGAERRALERLVALTAQRLGRALARRAIEAGDCAATSGERAGAFWLHHIAYALATGAAWRAEALRAARAIERAARSAGAPRSERMWRRRVVALERASG